MSKKCFEKRKRGDSLTSKSPHPPHLFHGVYHRADGFRLPLMCPATMYCELCKCTHSLHVPEDLFKILLLFQGGSWQSERSSTSPKAREVSAYSLPTDQHLCHRAAGSWRPALASPPQAARSTHSHGAPRRLGLREPSARPSAPR